MVVILAQSALVRMFPLNPQTACASGTGCLWVILFSLQRLISDVQLKCPKHKQENKSRSDFVTILPSSIVFRQEMCVFVLSETPQSKHVS